MQFFRTAAALGLVLGFAALAVPSSGAAVVAAGQASTSRMNPITRVVGLLENLGKEVEKKQKAEWDLYETFACWAKSIISQKTDANEAAQSRSDMLQTYIDDLDAGRIELTSENGDLTKQVQDLTADIKLLDDTRAQEKADFEEAKDEMEKAVDALSTAIEVLSKATEKHQTGVLLDVGAASGSSAELRARESASLSKAVELAQRVLPPGDAFFLQRVLTGVVPKANYKKLNRKATFKDKYKGRSFKIQDELAKLQKTFKSNLGDAKRKERDAVETYTVVKTAKDKEKTKAEQALADANKENGARAEAKQESETERDLLLAQIKNDKKYIEQVTKSYDDKKAEWKKRKLLMKGEVEAVSKAIGILRNDDARDLFAKSHDSQGYFFLQEGSSSTSARLASQAAATLLVAAKEAHSSRLAVLGQHLSSKANHFKEVIKAIDAMLKDHEEDESEDKTRKEKCEADRAEDTRNAVKIARAMDDLTDSIRADKAKVQEINAEIQDKKSQIASINRELKESQAIRKKEHADYQQSEQDDKAAIVVVKNAKKVLEKFYSDNSLSLGLIQQKSSKVVAEAQGPFKSEAGKAPPPPPSTWSEPHQGKTDESTSIVSMMETIIGDIEEDIKKAESEEAADQKLYEKTKLALETETKELGTAIDKLTEAAGDKTKAVKSNTDDRRDNNNDLSSEMKKIKEAVSDCDWFAVNYDVRIKNRRVEMDGLRKAKAILSGGKFSLIEESSHQLKAVEGHLRATRK